MLFLLEWSLQEKTQEKRAWWKCCRGWARWFDGDRQQTTWTDTEGTKHLEAIQISLNRLMFSRTGRNRLMMTTAHSAQQIRGNCHKYKKTKRWFESTSPAWHVYATVWGKWLIACCHKSFSGYYMAISIQPLSPALKIACCSKQSSACWRQQIKVTLNESILIPLSPTCLNTRTHTQYVYIYKYIHTGVYRIVLNTHTLCLHPEVYTQV